MEESKKKNNVGLLVLVVVLGIACLGMGSYIFINKDNKSISSEKTNTNTQNFESNQAQNNSTSNKDENFEQKNSVIVFDGSKSLNSSEKNYTLSCQGNAGIWITVNSNQKELTFSFTPTRVVEFYPLNWTSARIDMSSDVIKFDKKIIDVFFGGM